MRDAPTTGSFGSCVESGREYPPLGLPGRHVQYRCEMCPALRCPRSKISAESVRQRDAALVFYRRSAQHSVDCTVAPEAAMNVPTLRMSLRGMHLLDTPIFNKGTAFTGE